MNPVYSIHDVHCPVACVSDEKRPGGQWTRKSQVARRPYRTAEVEQVSTAEGAHTQERRRSAGSKASRSSASTSELSHVASKKCMAGQREDVQGVSEAGSHHKSQPWTHSEPKATSTLRLQGWHSNQGVQVDPHQGSRKAVLQAGTAS